MQTIKVIKISTKHNNICKDVWEKVLTINTNSDKTWVHDPFFVSNKNSETIVVHMASSGKTAPRCNLFGGTVAEFGVGWGGTIKF